jgi:hypothetical protein
MKLVYMGLIVGEVIFKLRQSVEFSLISAHATAGQH